MKAKAFSRTICALFLLLVVSGLANCGGNSSTGQLPPPPPANQTPTITFISPSSTAIGCAAFTLFVGGTNFVAASTVNFGGSPTATTFVSSTQLNAAIPAASIASTGTPAVTVTNPAPGGGTSNSVTFTTTTNSMGAVDPQSIAVDPAGKFAYVANGGCSGSDVGNVSMYTINATTGALASIGMIAAGTGPDSVAVDPAGKFAYVANSGSNDVSMYTIDATTGALASAGPPVPTNDIFTDFVTVDPLGKFAYVASSGQFFDCDFGSVLTYTINPTTGALTSNTGGIIGTGENGTPEFFNSVALDPSGKFAYAAEGGAFPAPFFGGSSSVSMFTVDATTGALTSIGMIAAGTGPDSVAVDPAGKFAYVTNFGSNDVSMYTINSTTGALTSVGTIAAGTNPVSVVVDPSGKFAYAVNFSSNDVSMYTINVTTGALTSIGTVAAGTSPTSITVHPSGNFAYVTNSGSNDISMYSIDAATGALTVLEQ